MKLKDEKVLKHSIFVGGVLFQICMMQLVLKNLF